MAAISLLAIHKNKILVGLSYILIASGLLLIGNAVFPILAYEVFTSKEFDKVETPKVMVYNPNLPKEALAQEPADLTNANNWFPENNAPVNTRSPKVEFYNLTIPKLGIKNAAVKIAGSDLNHSLIQYKGTANPGEPGNPVIFGHSILPQFYNPKNYISIFSTLPTLKSGDIILVDYDGIQYSYEVEQLHEVKPTDVSVLEQRYDRKEISLVTCVPPGTYLRRLIVKAKLVDNNK